ncbi:unnamed protein product [Mytilus edulis]|uniref:Uncharacterized protein n=1 Tax=Mytilus edulis TaxID=6550 RepID=A0A8S3SK49_MYTED|nr:unnamed protein product [Mytilus edulis]
MQRCADLKVCSLDSHDREILIEIRNMRSENIPKGATVIVTPCKTSDGIVIVAVGKEDAYFDRISNDIRNGHIANVFINSQMKYLSYQQKIIANLKKNKELQKIILFLSDKESSPLLTVANQGFNYLVHSLIEIGLSVNVRDETGRSPLSGNR